MKDAGGEKVFKDGRFMRILGLRLWNGAICVMKFRVVM